MKRKRVKFKLRSAERGVVIDCRMKLKSAEKGGCRSAEQNGGEAIKAAEHQWD
jgi:hypothetical protein